MKRSRALLYHRAYPNRCNGFQSQNSSKHHKKAKRKKDSRRTQNGTRPKTKRHKHPKRHSEGTCGAITLLPITRAVWAATAPRQVGRRRRYRLVRGVAGLGGDNDFNYDFHPLLIQTFARGGWLGARLSTEVRIRPNGEHPVTPHIS